MAIVRSGESRVRHIPRRWILPLAAGVAVFGVLRGARFGLATEGPLEVARSHFDAGKYEQGAATLRVTLGQSAQSAPLHHWLARCYFELRDFDHAVASAARSVELDPKNSDYHLWLGRAYGRKAENAGWFSAMSLAKKARREFEEAVRLNPASFQAQHDLIEFYLRAPGIVGGGDDKARQRAEALAALDAGESHLALGKFWAEKKNSQQAEAEYRKVLKARPKRIEAYLEVAEFYQGRKDAARMEEAVEAAARVDASDRRLFYFRGVAEVLAGKRLDEAERSLKSYLGTVPQRSDFPSHGSAHEWLGGLYEQQGKRGAAAEQYRAALALEPRSKSAHEALRRVQK